MKFEHRLNFDTGKHLFKKRGFKQIWIGYVPFFLLCALIYYFSSQSHISFPKGFRFEHADKLIHALAFCAIGFSAAFATWYRKGRLGFFLSFEALIMTVAYGALDEFHQFFVPLRTPDSMDLLADATGGLMGVFFWVLVVKLFFNKKYLAH